MLKIKWTDRLTNYGVSQEEEERLLFKFKKIDTPSE
jgi:hypothetical protein